VSIAKAEAVLMRKSQNLITNRKNKMRDLTNIEIQRLIEKLNYENSEMRDLLIEIIQTFDSQLNSQVQDTNNPVGFLRNKVDKLLNK